MKDTPVKNIFQLLIFRSRLLWWPVLILHLQSAPFVPDAAACALLALSESCAYLALAAACEF